MIWVFPAALLMQRIGRSIGFRVGSVFGMAGALAEQSNELRSEVDRFLSHIRAA